ncbi:MAG TPA: ABC transporter substrate-binding protein [Deinococcales bacterium]|nr:ABC transporter substrate-binding protein [Deinococcales bacterium]
MRRSLTLGMAAIALAAASTALAQAPQRGGTLQVATDQSPVGLDPHVATAFSTALINQNIYEGLTEIDQNLRVQPALASRWTSSDGGLKYTFTLRPNVVFHNGEAMTSSDVAYSFRRVMDAKTASPFASRLNLVKTLSTPNPTTFVIELSKPFAPLLSEIADIRIVPEQYVAGGGDLQRRAIGTGPFMLREWIPDTALVLERNPRYWRSGLPYLDVVRVNIVPDAATRQVGLASGTYHFLPNVDPSVAVTLKNTPNVQLIRSNDLAYTLVGMNTTRKPFDNPLVRQALNYALDRNQIVQAAYFGEGVPAGPLSPALKSWSTPTSAFACYRADPERARALLRQAGYPNGVDFELMTFGTIKTVLDVATVAQAQLQKAGFRPKLVVKEFGQFVQDWRNSNFDAFVSSNGGSSDPDGYLYRTFVTGGSTNVFKYTNPTVDQLLEKARTTVDAAQRRTMYAQLQNTLACSGPIAHVAYGTLFSVARENFRGYIQPPTRSLIFLRQAWLAR